MIYQRLIVHVLGLATTALLLQACSTPTPPTPEQPRFDLQGHRGARGHAPENTLAAFDRALDIGVTTLELDIGVTQDGMVVIGHDPKLNPNITRDAQGQWLEATGPAVNMLTLAQVQRYDVGRIKPGTRYAQTFAQQQPRDGERMPTLAALFERVKQRGDAHVRFNIETKLNPTDAQATVEPEAFVRALLAVVNAHGMASRVSVQSFDWRTLREVSRIAPQIPTVCLTVRQNWQDNIGANGLWTDGITLDAHGGLVPRMVKAAGCSTWSPTFADLDATQHAEARRLGLKTVVWTVNQPTDIERMLALEVDGIISDYPDRVRGAMAARGMAVPVPAQKK